MWNLPGPGVEPVSPALADGFPTTEPPGGSKGQLIWILKCPPAPFSQYPVFFYHRLSVPGFLKIYFIYFNFWLLWDFIAALRLSVVVEHRGPLSSCRAWASHCSGFSCHGAQALGCAGSVVAHGLSCPAACGIFPDQGSNLCPLHWQVDS